MEDDTVLASTVSTEALEAAAAAATTPAEPYMLREYLERLLPLVLSACTEDVSTSLFSYPDAQDLCRRFISDPQCQVIYVIKERVERADESTDGECVVFC
jgi:hypothetical protein